MKVFLSFLFVLTFFLAASNYSQVTINIPGDYPTIQEGIDAANNGDLVLVADGLYFENINFKGKAITVASHFLNNGNESHIENTIIDGSHPSHPDTGAVVSIISGEDTTSVLCGFTITGGTGTLGTSTIRAGGGISVNFSGAKICNNIIEYNSVNHTDYALGGGIIIYSSSYVTIVKNNIIRNNSVDGNYPWGGGISLAFSELTYILSNKIIDNEATGTSAASGGGIDVAYANAETVINGNYIKGNDTQISGYGGGGIDLYAWGAPVTVSNNLIVDNNARWGGGVLVDFGGANSSKPDNLNAEDFPRTKKELTLSKRLEDIPVLVNNTIINNFGTIGGGIYTRYSTPEVMNNIVWGNTSTSGGQINGAATVTYSDVEGGYPGEGNIDIDPEFADSSYYLLTENVSLCIDAGDPDPIYNDVDDPNNPGFALYPAMGALRNDMGTFGGPNSTWSSVLSDTLFVPGDYLTIQAAIDAANNEDVVLVADGLYYENINYKGKAITVASHFLVDGDSTHIENTIIDGSQPSHPDSGSVVYFVSGEDTTSVLCGFTITRGTGTYTAQFDDVSGGGIYIWPSGAKICNNIIENNSASYNINSFGGGILGDLDSNNIIIENNIIRNNTITATAWVQGGGIALYNFAYARILNNKIIDNTANSSTLTEGGGITCSGPSDEIFIIGNYIKGNECNPNNGGGGGLDLYNCTAIVRNNLIVENSANSGGGINLELVASASKSGLNAGRRSIQNDGDKSSQYNSSEILLASSFENNTVINNIAALYGGGIKILGTVPQLMNCIIWGNTQVAGSQIYGNADVQYSDVEGGYIGTGNIIMDPNFITDNPYYLLSSSSPCIDRGNPDPIYNDAQDPQNPGNPMWPSQGTLRNDMGHCGGPASLWCFWDWPMPVESSSHSVSEFALMHNYPNPFNPTTTIKYEIKEITQVELKVFDILGREVIALVSEEQPAGSYEIVFDASALSSGIYFYKLEAGDFIQTNKMMLLK